MGKREETQYFIETNIDGIFVVYNEDAKNVTEEELKQYVKRAKTKFPSANWDGIELIFDGDDVDIYYHFTNEPFNRIRRITGYLVGTTDSWNNAKQDELKNRVKHGVHSGKED